MPFSLLIVHNFLVIYIMLFIGLYLLSVIWILGLSHSLLRGILLSLVLKKKKKKMQFPARFLVNVINITVKWRVVWPIPVHLVWARPLIFVSLTFVMWSLVDCIPRVAIMMKINPRKLKESVPVLSIFNLL